MVTDEIEQTVNNLVGEMDKMSIDAEMKYQDLVELLNRIKIVKEQLLLIQNDKSPGSLDWLYNQIIRNNEKFAMEAAMAEFKKQKQKNQ